MKKMTSLLMVSLVICTTILCTGCGQTKVIDGVAYDTYGLINQGDKKNPEIQYEPIWGNIIWGAILCETVVAPIYFFGFSMFEPVGAKADYPVKGQVVK